jgi:hypothetical protein
MGEHDQRARIGVHRAGDVEEENKPPPPPAPLPPGPLERLSAGAEGAAQRSAEVGGAGPRGTPPSRSPRGHGELDPRHEPGKLSELLRRAIGEAFLAEKLVRARPRGLAHQSPLDAHLDWDAPRLPFRRAEEVCEDAVVDGDLGFCGHERRSAGPVEILGRE